MFLYNVSVFKAISCLLFGRLPFDMPMQLCPVKYTSMKVRETKPQEENVIFFKYFCIL